MNHRFLAPARAELEEAVDYYESCRPGLGDEFAAEIQRAIARILQHPLAHPRISKRSRRCRVARFTGKYSMELKKIGGIEVAAESRYSRSASLWKIVDSVHGTIEEV